MYSSCYVGYQWGLVGVGEQSVKIGDTMLEDNRGWYKMQLAACQELNR